MCVWFMEVLQFILIFDMAPLLLAVNSVDTKMGLKYFAYTFWSHEVCRHFALVFKTP